MTSTSYYFEYMNEYHVKMKYLCTFRILGTDNEWRSAMLNCIYTFDYLVKCSFLKIQGSGLRYGLVTAPITHLYNVIDDYHFEFITISQRFKVFYHIFSFLLGANGASNCISSFEKSAYNPHGNISISA